jgi:hypothetical protein
MKKGSNVTGVQIRVGVLIVLLIGMTGFAGYKYGYQQADTKLSAAHQKELKDQKDFNLAVMRSGSGTDAQYSELVTRYNKLVGDYNSLRSNVITYINQQQVPAKTSLSCRTNTIGSTTYTNCD